MFSKVIFIIAFCMSLTLLLDNSAFADVISPKKQMVLSFSSDEIICKEGPVRVTNVNYNHPACVKISSVTKLTENIVHLRNDLNRAKVEMSSVLNTR